MSKNEESRTKFIRRRTGVLGKLVRPNSYDEHGNPVSRHSENKEKFNGFKNTLRDMALILTNKKKQPYPDGTKFSIIMNRWGIVDKTQLRTVMRNMRVEQIIWMGLALYSLIQMFFVLGSGINMEFWFRTIGGTMVFIFAAFKILIVTWRLDVLRKRQWITFPSWLYGKKFD